MIKNPVEKYNKLRQTNQEALSYDNLIPYTENKQGWITPKEQSFNESKEKPSQFIQQILGENGQGCIKVWAGTNPNKPSEFILNLRFSNEHQASEFKKNHCGQSTSTSADRKTVTLTQKTIVKTLKQLGIVHYGAIDPVPIMQALQQEHRQQTTLNTSIGFFCVPGKENLVEQLVKTLLEQPEASTSFFHKSLIDFLKELPAIDPSLLMTKMKDFTQALSTHTVEKEAHTQLLVSLILDSETKNLCDLIDKLNEITSQEAMPVTPTDNRR